MLAIMVLLNANMAAPTTITAAKNISSVFLGTCLPSLTHNASRFKVQYLYFDEMLKMYFRKPIYIFAYDHQKICKSGDIALIKELPEVTNRTINHEVVEVVYALGDLIDPITGKKVANGNYRDEMEITNSFYGPKISDFHYKKAPRRGWQEGRKDFTHRESYYKYHEFEKGDENEHQPYSYP